MTEREAATDLDGRSEKDFLREYRRIKTQLVQREFERADDVGNLGEASNPPEEEHPFEAPMNSD